MSRAKKAAGVGVAVTKREGLKRGLQAVKNNLEPEDSGMRTLGGFGPKTKSSVRKGTSKRLRRLQRLQQGR